MRIFAIKDEELSASTILAYLLYYEKAKRFYIELPDDADPWETPLLLSSFLKRGEHTVNAYWSKMWVQQRIVPPDRQNLGQVLKANGLDEYDEFDLLLLANGRCAQDSCYLEEIGVDEIPDALQMRWEKKIEDVVPLADHHLLVFFRDGSVRKCNIGQLVKDIPAFRPVIRNETLYCSVAVQTDGYGIRWSEQASLDNMILYHAGIEIPLSLNDFCSFIAHRVVNSAEAAGMLGCSRQNIEDLTRRGKLYPIRLDARNKLFLKNEIQQRMWE